MQILRAVIAVAALLGVAAAVAVAQAPVPTVTITASATALTAAPTPVAPGATRFELVSSDQKSDLSVFLVAVKPGRTTDEAIAAVRRDPNTSFEVIDVVASATLEPGGRRAITAPIKADTAYLLVNDVGEDEKTAEWIITPLAAGGAPTGATAPKPDAEVEMRDNRFEGDRTLPRRGSVRVRNIGWAPHFAQAFRLRSGASRSAFGRAIRGSSQKAFGRVVDFRYSRELTNVLSRGSVADQEIRFNRRGRYVLVCFFEGHEAQGMYRFVSVR